MRSDRVLRRAVPPREPDTQRWQGLAAYVRTIRGTVPWGRPIAGRVEGRPWTTAIDYTQTRELMRHLGTACFIVIAYLTGMRPGEVLGLTAGCCPALASGRHLIHRRVFKHASGDARPRPRPALRLHRPRLPADPRGHGHVARLRRTAYPHRGLRPLGLRPRSSAQPPARERPRRSARRPRPRPFRRTLAWHIARRPAGLVALAIQYGHLRTAVSAGYASRSRDGIHDLLDIETARATADTLTALHTDLQAGASISGPAARRAIRAAGQAPAFTGAIRTSRQARDILDNPQLAVYDNPHAFVMCVYDRDRALCHRLDTTDSPSLDRCRPSCTNIARTDDHAAQLTRRAAALEAQADTEAVPGPLTDRLRHHAAALRIWGSRTRAHPHHRPPGHQETGS